MRRFYCSILILIVILAVTQTTVLDYFKIMGVKPLLILCVVVSTALIRGSAAGGITGFCGGLLLDVLDVGAVGLNAMLFMYIGILCSRLCRGMFREKVIVIVWFTFCANMAYSILYYFVTYFIWGEMNFFPILVRRILPEAMYTVVACVPLFYMVRGLNKRFAN